ncbi:MAG: CRISPR-associated helicase Cas3' [Pyrinomonadaceae bacterium]|nr:CRISPR-associated helicase Cas3' [Pyrinomonadaceae bacterium]
MSEFKVLLAKSWRAETPEQEAPDYARLVAHLQAVELAGASIREIVGELILRQLKLSTDEWLSRLSRALKVACLCHDLGKANEGFQEMVTGKREPTQQPARHELLSALLLEDKTKPFRAWALEMLKEDDEEESTKLLDCVIGAVAGHHLKMDKSWHKAMLALRGGCGLTLSMLLTHSDMENLFDRRLISEEIRFSLVENEPTYLGARQLRFNVNSNTWRKQLNKDAEWWRFAAAIKALLMAADVAGSAMAPAGEDIKRWVHATLSQRVKPKDMNDVVSARLRGAKPRPFQAAIGQSRKRVTLVEAGCGTGKTAAAYMWAAHHANDKKLFFCYPTTGTATEGFLGYVHETDVEAKLVHSRSIVDLAGIAQVTDDEENDHLMRIESLNLWSPKVIICTADTVLALVRNNRRGLYNSPAIFSGSFVFDELHSYDEQMMAAVPALIKALPGASFLLMTASLPKDRKEFLQRHIEDLCEVPSPTELEEIPRYEFQCTDIEDAYRQAQAAVAEKQRVLWICNTVARAQKVRRILAEEYDVPTRSYHSRFKYTDRVRQHRKIIRWFKQQKRQYGIVAVTTQVAEMSLDLDADSLISEVAPIPALIQRLGRLNRRVTPEHPGAPRKAIFLTPDDEPPYTEKELQLAETWIDELMSLNHPLRQIDLAELFNALSPQEKLEWSTRTGWLDSGWLAEPEEVRKPGYSVSVIMHEDEEACRQSKAEIIKRAIPMNYRADRMEHWREYKGHLIAPPGAIKYNPKTGAVLL